ncbi:hypothetical protein CLF_104186 [Clonorchis sinensis]|uniref:Uncharacterized protein n=1 Tax=Clonorchis sinensis TaxID=79923 RepID=G7YNS0_CLOSI|nr:hypothetical protein CLF_104186 [Clonorchis sinensis]
MKIPFSLLDSFDNDAEYGSSPTRVRDRRLHILVTVGGPLRLKDGTAENLFLEVHIWWKAKTLVCRMMVKVLAQVNRNEAILRVHATRSSGKYCGYDELRAVNQTGYDSRGTVVATPYLGPWTAPYMNLLAEESLVDMEHADVVLIFQEEEKVQLFLIKLTKVIRPLLCTLHPQYKSHCKISGIFGPDGDLFVCKAQIRWSGQQPNRASESGVAQGRRLRRQEESDGINKWHNRDESSTSIEEQNTLLFYGFPELKTQNHRRWAMHPCATEGVANSKQTPGKEVAEEASENSSSQKDNENRVVIFKASALRLDDD